MNLAILHLAEASSRLRLMLIVFVQDKSMTVLCLEQAAVVKCVTSSNTREKY